MRLIIVTAAALLLAGAAPALAHDNNLDAHDHKNCTLHSKITETDPYEGEFVFEDTVYAQGGWWTTSRAGFDQSSGAASTDGPHWKCGGDKADDAFTRDSPVWLHLLDSDGANYEIEVTSHGSAVAAVDVFEFEQTSGHQATPTCPQGLVFPDIYPQDGESAGLYLQRIASETADRHQRGQSARGPILLSSPTTNTISISLNPDHSHNGEYVVAIYPQASTTADEAPQITYEIKPSDGNMEVDDGLNQPGLPYDATSWLFPLGGFFDCVDKAVPLPPVIASGGAPEFLSPSQGAEDLLTTHLEPTE